VLVQAIQMLRPNGILPHHEQPRATELAHVLRRPPLDLATEVTDYLEWRGLRFDHDTVRLIRRIVELSDSLRSVTGLARSMYMSRRALGRRFMTLGLPVPSHWLQMARLLRVVIRLQNTDDSVFSVACAQGYPDGFSVSNQMYRLFGCRPTEVRERLGWEWVFEAWLRREAEAGAFAPANADKFSGASIPGGHTARLASADACKAPGPSPGLNMQPAHSTDDVAVLRLGVYRGTTMYRCRP
jgi:AraC-like DNA-binding protein